MSKYRGMAKLLCQCEGSIIPLAVQVATPCAMLSAVLKWLEVHELAGLHLFFDVFSIKGAAYGSFSSLLGFLVVFRTSQAYNRYWTGGGLLQQMVGSWFDSASSTFAFLKMSKAGREEVRRLEHLLVRLYSMLCALAMTELEGADEGDDESFYNRLNEMEIIDVDSLDSDTLDTIRACTNKIELIFHWIQVVLVNGIEKGIINMPPPILSRSFLELADGMVKFHDCLKISMLPFPFPYSQATLVLLILHWLITPMMICTWTSNASMAALFSFLIVFIFWGLYGIATELENPFGDDPNDLDALEVMRHFNEKLRLLTTFEGLSREGPSLCDGISLTDLDSNALNKRTTLSAVWRGTRKMTHFTNLGNTVLRKSPTLTEIHPLLEEK